MRESGISSIRNVAPFLKVYLLAVIVKMSRHLHKYLTHLGKKFHRKITRQENPIFFSFEMFSLPSFPTEKMGKTQKETIFQILEGKHEFEPRLPIQTRL